MKTFSTIKRIPRFLGNLFLVLSLMAAFLPGGLAAAAGTPNPTTVTIAGSLQSELGCAGDWDPACSASGLTFDAADDVWQATYTLPAGNWEYKAALNGSWAENYGLHAVRDGGNIPLNLASSSSVKFYYDHKSNWVTDNQTSVIGTVPGDFQSELGCPGDWQPDCLRSWLQDTDGDGTYTFSTTAIPPGNYEAKVAINEGWDENYGQGGTPGGANIPFSVTVTGSTVAFSYNSASHLLSIQVTPPGLSLDDNIFWDGLRHDSRDLLYRTPGGAVASDTPVTLRFRTFHNDVSGVKVRFYDLNAGAQKIVDMTLAASDVSCYQPGLNYTCDFWAYTLPNATPNNLWYRFIITDGTKTVYYADDTPALDGGLGSPSNDPQDNSYALMVYDPAFKSPAWAQKAVVYQIFPDRFRSGRSDNNPHTGDVRYDDPVLKLAWGTLPEGFCRNYAGFTTTTCPWRFGPPPPWGVGQKETPRGRDYMGGDLKGVDQKLDYLVSLGVNTLYFNPIFDAGSNHSYDTQDYFKIDPYFGTQKDWDNLVKHANQLGVRIVLDGVYNHLSSDSPFFDRYQHYSTLGACESVTSIYRDWFTFHNVPAGTGTCAGPNGPRSATYDGWFGFDTIPVLNKSNSQVQAYFLTGANSVAKYWLVKGASGWRLDVMGDSSFPAGYWESFRQVVKARSADTLIIGELWQKDSTLLRFLRGDRADTTMNYRLRDAVLGLLAPTNFDSKGFADSGHPIKPSEFAARLSSIREDYPDAAFYSLMNLLGSHDTARLLWVLTPGLEKPAEKENAANLLVGKQSVKIASLIQFTLPGAPTVYYGDEVGLTGQDDPDDRRTYPWADLGGSPDLNMFAHYQALTGLRKQFTALTAGDLRMLLADDAAGTLAYGRKTTSQAALVVVNRSPDPHSVSIPLAGYLPNGLAFSSVYGVGNPASLSAVVADGALSVDLKPHSALLLVTGNVDLLPPLPPANLQIITGNAKLDLTWDASAGAAGYNLYRSPLSGGGWVKLNASPIDSTTYSDVTVENTRLYYYVVTALDAAGNESGYSNQVSAIPHLAIGWANLQWPPTLQHVVSVVNRTADVYGQVWIDGVTNQPGATPGLSAQLGFGPVGSNPAGNPDWIWVPATFNVDAGNNDEFKASLLPDALGTYDYLYRYSTTAGHDWLYADLDGIIPAGNLPKNPGKLTVSSSGDTTPPAVPTGFHVVSASPSGINLAWDAITGDDSLYGYEVLRGDASGGPFTLVARLTGLEYADKTVTSDTTYFYVLRSVDNSFNRSASTDPVQATASLRDVTLNFNLTVPDTTDATGRSVYIAGFLDRLNGGLPPWNPGGVVLTRSDATHWTITLTGKEDVQIEYKYTLGDWDHVEKDASCGEVGNRILTLAYGSTGVMNVNDTVLNWRNVAPCGN
ncbi:MAG TPA: alpha-amylase family glycosyl hydrolase [Anaerolineales bacterium]|jgi:glycosidase